MRSTVSGQYEYCWQHSKFENNKDISGSSCDSEDYSKDVIVKKKKKSSRNKKKKINKPKEKFIAISDIATETEEVVIITMNLSKKDDDFYTVDRLKDKILTSASGNNKDLIVKLTSKSMIKYYEVVYNLGFEFESGPSPTDIFYTYIKLSKNTFRKFYYKFEDWESSYVSVETLTDKEYLDFVKNMKKNKKASICPEVNNNKSSETINIKDIKITKITKSQYGVIDNTEGVSLYEECIREFEREDKRKAEKLKYESKTKSKKSVSHKSHNLRK
jgi:hypothetical protein